MIVGGVKIAGVIVGVFIEDVIVSGIGHRRLENGMEALLLAASSSPA